MKRVYRGRDSYIREILVTVREIVSAKTSGCGRSVESLLPEIVVGVVSSGGGKRAVDSLALFGSGRRLH